MVSPWNIYSFIPLSLLLSILVKALTGENIESTQDPGSDPALWFLGQRSHRPQRPDLAPMGNPYTGPESDSLGQPLSWIWSSSEEHDGQGGIGEYGDLQESTETFVRVNERAREDTTSERSKHTTSSSTIDAPPDSHHDQTKYQSAETTTATSLLDPPQTGESRLTFPTIQNKMTDNQFPFRLPGSLKPNKDSLQPAGRGPSTERPAAAQDTESLRLTTGISFTTKGKIAGITNAADNILYKGTVSTQPEKDDHKNDELHVPKPSSAVLLDGNMDTSVTSCKTMNQSWTPTSPEDLASSESLSPFVALGPSLLVPLYSDWNSALATWGFAWEAHVYGIGSIFAAFCLISMVCLLGLPLRCPPGSPYFMLLHLFILAFAGIQAFSLLYDAYSYQDRLPPLVSMLLYELPFPCLISAFSLAFFLLSLRSRMYLSLPLALSATCSALPRPGLLLFMSMLHFIISLGCVGILQIFHKLPVVILLFPQCLFVCLTVLLSFSYLIFFCLTQVNTKHIYRLNDNGESGESPEAIQPTICPFARVEDWERAAGAAVGTSFCLLGCGGLQLYGILHAFGLGGVDGFGFQPWPWWGYQVGCRICEIGVSLGLSLIATHPLFCQNNSSIKTITQSRPGSWSRLSCSSPLRGPTLPQMGGSDSPILPTQDSLSQGKPEKLVVCDVVTNGQSEALQLCSMEESPGNKLDHRSKLIQTKTVLPLPTLPCLPLQTKNAGKSQLYSLDSWGLESDSTVDLRPPSPIDLSRSIDQALFSESLFSHSIFGLPRVSHASSSLSLNSPIQSTSKQEPRLVGDTLYRTSSCGDVDQQNTLSSSRPSQPHDHMTSPSNTTISPEQLNWKGSVTGSTQGLCNRPKETSKLRSNSWANRGQNFAQSSLPRAIPHLSYHRRYRTLSLASQDSQGSGRLAGTKKLSESKQLEWDLAVQAEFVSVCRQIDALSVCSDTIEL